MVLLVGGCSALPNKSASLQFSPMAPQALPPTPIPDPPPALEKKPQDKTDVWSHLSKGFSLEGADRVEPRRVAARHAAHPGATRHTLRRAEPYLWEIIEQVEARGIPMEIALLPAIETRFNPKARSPRGAAGLWQFLPSTGKHYGLTQDWWQDGRLDTVKSTRAALDYLSYLHGRYDDWLLALAAYNAGESRVARAIEKNRKRGKPADYWHINLPDETRRYVPRLLGLAHFIKNSDDYGFVLPKVADGNDFTVVKLQHQLDLTLAAELAGLPLSELLRYNPGLKHWTTGPTGDYHLILPKPEGKRLRTALNALPGDHWLTWKRHRIKKGDTLVDLADRYATTTAILRRINELKGDYLRAGNSILVPIPRHTNQLLVAGLPVPKAVQQSTVAEYAGQKTAGKPIKIASQVGSHQVRYQIQAGDTLLDIAKAYGVSVEALAGWNNLKPTSLLRPGRMLTIYIGNRKSVKERQTPA